jgi:hypothetical protein
MKVLELWILNQAEKQNKNRRKRNIGGEGSLNEGGKVRKGGIRDGHRRGSGQNTRNKAEDKRAQRTKRRAAKDGHQVQAGYKPCDKTIKVLHEVRTTGMCI